MKKGLLLLAVALLAACNAEPVKVDDGSGGQKVNRRLFITTEHRYDAANSLDSLLPNVTIEMYLDPQDRIERTNLDRQRITNDSGVATIEYLKDTTYYIRLEHPDLGVQERDVIINDQTLTAYEYFLFQ